MRALIQRVGGAKVSVNGEVVSSIGKGLCVLIGINRDDGPKDLEYIVRKILNVRLFDDESGVRWKCSAKEKQLEILCVSQFTLYHELKGNKPDFHNSMGPDAAKTFYSTFLDELKKQYNPALIKDGKFGEYMKVEIDNDGPVTIMLESLNSKGKGGNDKNDTAHLQLEVQILNVMHRSHNKKSKSRLQKMGKMIVADVKITFQLIALLETNLPKAKFSLII